MVNLIAIPVANFKKKNWFTDIVQLTHNSHPPPRDADGLGGWSCWGNTFFFFPLNKTLYIMKERKDISAVWESVYLLQFAVTNVR